MGDTIFFNKPDDFISEFLLERDTALVRVVKTEWETLGSVAGI